MITYKVLSHEEALRSVSFDPRFTQDERDAASKLAKAIERRSGFQFRSVNGWFGSWRVAECVFWLPGSRYQFHINPSNHFNVGIEQDN